MQDSKNFSALINEKLQIKLLKTKVAKENSRIMNV